MKRLLLLLFLSPLGLLAQVPTPNTNYQTNFPLTQNPISEGGNWLNGNTNGGGKWGNVQTTPGMVFGTVESAGCPGTATLCNDNTAVLTGTWQSTQMAMATVRIANSSGLTSGAHEVELRLRSTINATGGGTNSGYEINCSVNTGNPYVQIVRWNGALGSFSLLNSQSPGSACANGDVLAATAIGSTISVYKSSGGGSLALIFSVTDSTFSGGSPGVGFFNNNDTNQSFFGFSNFTAWDGPAAAQMILPATCSQANVSSALTSIANDGSVVLIPPGTCLWASGINYTQTKTFVLAGAGAISGDGSGSNTSGTGFDNTIIQDGAGGNNVLTFTFINGKSSRITGFALAEGSGGATKNGAQLQLGGSSVSTRLDHMHFNQLHGGSVVQVEGCVYGVGDHNQFDAILSETAFSFRYHHGNCNGDTTNNGNGTWAAADLWGSSSFFYTENNNFQMLPLNASAGAHNFDFDCGRGGRFVFRYNYSGFRMITQTHFDPGGSPNVPIRPCRAHEEYNNIFAWSTSPSTDSGGMLEDNESGAGLFYSNTISALTTVQRVQITRQNNATYTWAAPPNGWGYCGTANGPSNWDENTGSTGYRCLDQVGAGQGDLLTNTAPNNNPTTNSTTGCVSSQSCAWPREALSPWYVWNNAFSPVPNATNHLWADFNSPTPVVENRDYYLSLPNVNEPGTFTGATGMGCGPTAAGLCTTPVARPATCTAGPTTNSPYNTPGSPGVGYWDNSTTPGKLYVCTATNTWTPYYTPYTYPHPLVGGAAPTIVIPTVTTTTATSITTTTASSGGTVTSNGGDPNGISSEGVCYATTANPTSPCTSNGTASPFTSSISGLTTNTLYHYRAFAANTAGTGFGSDLTFTTLSNGAVPPSFSPAPGTYTTPQNVVLTTTTPGAQIIYTMDGDVPTSTNGAFYSSYGPIVVSFTDTIKAYTTAPGFVDSPVVTATYTINPGPGPQQNYTVRTDKNGAAPEDWTTIPIPCSPAPCNFAVSDVNAGMMYTKLSDYNFPAPSSFGFYYGMVNSKVNQWEMNDNEFVINENPGGGLIVLKFDPVAQTVSKVNCTRSASGCNDGNNLFINLITNATYLNNQPHKLIGFNRFTRSMLTTEDYTAMLTNPTGSPILTDITASTAVNCPGIPTSKVNANNTGNLVVSADDQKAAEGYGGGQNAFMLLYFFDATANAGAGGCRWFDTSTGTIGGSYGPTGSVQSFDDNGNPIAWINNSTIHSLDLDRSGTLLSWQFLTDPGGPACVNNTKQCEDAWRWDVTSLRAYRLNYNRTPQHMFGHDVALYNGWAWGWYGLSTFTTGIISVPGINLIPILGNNATGDLPTAFNVFCCDSHENGNNQLPAVIPSSFFGMHVAYGTTSYSTPILPPIIVGEQGKPAGTNWPYLESARGTYSFTNLDNAMVFSQANNAPLFYSFEDEPIWAVTDTSGCVAGAGGTQKCPSAPSDLTVSAACQAPLLGTTTTDCQLKEFVTTLVQRYKSTGTQTGCTAGNPQCNGVIPLYESWNEPIGLGTGGVLTNAQLVTLSTDYLNTIRANDPNAKVCSPAFTISAALPSRSTLMQNFFSGGGPTTYDCYDFHINETTPEAQIADINTFKANLTTAGVVNPTIYATEAGRWGGCATSVSGMTQQAYIGRIELLYASNNVKRHYWYAYDICPGLTNQPGTSTLNAAGIGYGNVESWMIGANLSTPCAANGTVWTCGLTRPSGYRALAVWDTSGSSTFSVPSQYTQFQDLEGNTTAAGATITIGTEPILLENGTIPSNLAGPYPLNPVVWAPYMDVNPPSPWVDEFLATTLDGFKTTYRFAHLFDRYHEDTQGHKDFTSSALWQISHDGQWIIWASDWTGTRDDAYLVSLNPTNSVAAPTFSPVGNATYAATQNVTILTGPLDTGVTVHHCFDNTPLTPCTPNVTGTTATINSTGYLRANVTAAGKTTSATSSALYSIGSGLAVPTFNPLPGVYTTTGMNITMTPPSGATVCFTIDGSTPTDDGNGNCLHGNIFPNPILYNPLPPQTLAWPNCISPCNINAISIQVGQTASVMTTGTFTTSSGTVASLTPATLAFGNQNINTTSTVQLATLTNTGTNSVTVSAVTIAANFARSGGTCSLTVPFTLAVGASCTIGVNFTPTVAQNYNGTLVVTSNAPTLTTNLTGTGTTPAQPTATLLPTTMAFGNQAINTTSSPISATLTNTGTVNVNVTSVTVSPSIFAELTTDTCPNAPFTLPPTTNNSCTIAATFTPTAAQAYSGTLSVASNAPTLTVNLTGTGTNTVATSTLTPASFNFGQGYINSSNDKSTFTFSNTGSVDITVSNVIVSGADFVYSGGTCPNTTPTTPFTVPAGTSCSFIITFTPLSPGNKSGSLSVNSNSSNASQSSFSGVGIPVQVFTGSGSVSGNGSVVVRP